MEQAVNGELAGLRGLVIDDSKTIRTTAEQMLKKRGYEGKNHVHGL